MFYLANAKSNGPSVALPIHNSEVENLAAYRSPSPLVPAVLAHAFMCSPQNLAQERRHRSYGRRVMAEILSIDSDREPTESDFSEVQGLLPIQFYGARRGRAQSEPLRHLMIAMLVDAVRCFEAKFDARQPARSQEFAEVRSWIFSDVDDGVFSFRAVCDALELDSGAIRKGLTRWQEKRRAGGKRRILKRSASRPIRLSA
jgi:hypothetical protein